MGQKVNPLGFRLAVSKDWQSRWFAADKASYRRNLLEDFKIRKFLLERLKPAGIVRVQIDRLINKMKITLFVSRPGAVIGRGGSGLQQLKIDLVKIVDIADPEKNLDLDNVVEVRDAELSAYLINLRVKDQLEKRMPYRRVAVKTIERAMSSGAKGIRIILSGRVGGAEIGRTERFQDGKVPLQTLRADIDFSKVPAFTKSGYVGIKVWIYKGEK
jgi:small subunit ribosomal protein S3